VPWRFTLAALQLLALTKSNQRETPRDKAVASAKSFSPYFVAASVILHGARPWHQVLVSLATARVLY